MMKIKIGDQLKPKNIEVLHGYYDSKYDNEILTVTDTKVPKVVNRSGGSSYFAILTANTKTKIGHEKRFSVSLDQINTKNFLRAIALS